MKKVNAEEINVSEESETKNIVLSAAIKDEIKKNVTELKELLQNDKDFADQLINDVLLIGKGVYTDSIQDFIWGEYRSNPDVAAALCENAYLLGKLVYGTSPLVREEVFKKAEVERENYKYLFRNEIEQEIYNVFYDEKETEIIGEIN